MANRDEGLFKRLRELLFESESLGGRADKRLRERGDEIERRIREAEGDQTQVEPDLQARSLRSEIDDIVDKRKRR